jgi:hypothetical protein
MNKIFVYSVPKTDSSLTNDTESQEWSFGEYKEISVSDFLTECLKWMMLLGMMLQVKNKILVLIVSKTRSFLWLADWMLWIFIWSSE